MVFMLRVVNDTYVGVSSRSELFNAAVWTNVFNAVTKRDLVLNWITTTTARLLFASFCLHHNIHNSLQKHKIIIPNSDHKIHLRLSEKTFRYYRIKNPVRIIREQRDLHIQQARRNIKNPRFRDLHIKLWIFKRARLDLAEYKNRALNLGRGREMQVKLKERKKGVSWAIERR